MKRILILVLCLVLLCGTVLAIAGCDTTTDPENSNAESNGDTSAEESKEVDPNAAYKDETGKYKTKLGVLDEYKDRTFTIVVIGEGSGTYQSDDFTTVAGSGGIDYGDTFYTEVNARNELVEERYGVTLNVEKVDGAVQKVRDDALSSNTYDAIILNVDDMCMLAQEGLLKNLRELEKFDVDAPWWDANANKAYSISDRLYFSTGDITIMNKANTWSILFNKDLVEKSNLDNPYELYRNGTWTFDKMIEMSKAVSNATNPQDWQDATKTFGMISAYGDILEFWGGFGNLICDKDASDIPYLQFGKTEASVTQVQHVLDTFKDASWNLYAQECTGGSNVWNDSFSVFYEGRALFRPSGFTATTKLRALAQMEFGILPLPKYDSSDDGYRTSTSGSFAAGIMNTCLDPEFSGYMLDAFASEAKNFITPAYIDVNLKWKSLRDNESEEILEYIFDNIVYDIGKAYNFGKVTSIFSNQAQGHSSDIVSALDGIKATIENDINNVIADYESN